MTNKQTIDTKEGVREVDLTPMRAIRYKCMECCCFDWAEVRECELTECPLWSYRMGHRPQDND